MSNSLDRAISDEKIFFKIRRVNNGVEFRMIDYRHPTPVFANFLLEDENDNGIQEVLGYDALIRIELTVGFALAQTINHNANFN